MRKRKAEIISFSLILIFRIIRFGWSSAQTIISLKTPLPLFKCKCIHTNNNCTPLRIHFFQSSDSREPRFWFVVCSNQNEEHILLEKRHCKLNIQVFDKNRALSWCMDKLRNWTKDKILFLRSRLDTIGMISKVLFITFDFETCHFVKVYPLSIAVPS